MCDYDVRTCKIILYIVTFLIAWFSMDFYYNKLPLIQEQCRLEELERKNEQKDLIAAFASNMKVDVSGYIIEPSISFGR